MHIVAFCCIFISCNAPSCCTGIPPAVCVVCADSKAPTEAPEKGAMARRPYMAALLGSYPNLATKRPVAISAGLSLFKNGAHLVPFEILCIFHFWNKEKAPLMVPSFLPFLPSPLTPIYSIFSFSPLLSPQKKVCKNARA